MDHTSLATIVSAAKGFLVDSPRLDGLINNAGIMATPSSVTKDGYEAQWQVNYLAHWLFTYILMPKLLETSKMPGVTRGGVRIVNLSSIGHLNAPSDGIHFVDTSLKDIDGSGMQRYGQSKLANVLHTANLHAAYGPNSQSATDGKGEVWTITVHPGLVETNLADGANDLPKWMTLGVGVALKLGMAASADKGSWTSVYCVAAKEVTADDAGRYFQRMVDRNGRRSANAKDGALAKRLEEWATNEMRNGGWLKHEGEAAEPVAVAHA
jgi:NAD(P)-dependent dehydrogenase (short-subunit alcohol dehydrogenase family)